MAGFPTVCVDTDVGWLVKLGDFHAADAGLKRSALGASDSLQACLSALTFLWVVFLSSQVPSWVLFFTGKLRSVMGRESSKQGVYGGSVCFLARTFSLTCFDDWCRWGEEQD